ncbi:MAG: FmdE family protein [bacterium]
MSPVADSGAHLEIPEDLQKTIDFHGHLCPGILIGYRASREALKRLESRRSKDEELVAIVENDSCSADAVQVLTGATFGKGNFFFRDHGKQAFTFMLRPSGKGVRLALKAGALGDGNVSREDKSRTLLSEPAEDLFDIQEDTMELPPEAEIRKSVVCPSCGEPVMDSRTRETGGKLLCIPCAEKKKNSS